jgi:hypothetical protein
LGAIDLLILFSFALFILGLEEMLDVDGDDFAMKMMS